MILPKCALIWQPTQVKFAMTPSTMTGHTQCASILAIASTTRLRMKQLDSVSTIPTTQVISATPQLCTITGLLKHAGTFLLAIHGSIRMITP
jgi:hypothetical protein